ncbi:MAG: histidine kinase [Candidatus Limnocylindrales bacterium]
MTTSSELADQLAAEAEGFDRDIAEIDLLVAQATTEATRHQSRRQAAEDKLAKLGDDAALKDVVEFANQLVTLTRRSALMDTQLEILEAKKRSAARLQEVLARDADRVRAIGTGSDDGTPEPGPVPTADDDGSVAPAVSRLVLAAQEDLRREIARAMHDGPAQSLTNIVLQAEIVERLVKRDPELAAGELRNLVAMVQQTLEATKTFIFDVRPMVLDDLGLVPTLRRAARDRGKRSGIVVEFEAVGVDRRLDPDMESGLFRIADEVLAAYLAARPDRVSLGIDWGEALVLTLHAERTAKAAPPLDIPDDREELPPALAAMVAERRFQHEAAVAAAKVAAIVKVPARLLRDLRQRAGTLGIGIETLDERGTLKLTLAMPAVEDPGSAADDAPG